MRPVKYPIDPVALGEQKSRYYNAIGGRSLEKRWKILRSKIPNGRMYPKKLSRLVCTDFHHLYSYYCIYINNPIIDDADLEEAKLIFDYKGKHGAIANFFMDKVNGFDLSVCHYCEMAFINVYSIDATEEGLDFINTQDDQSLKDKLNITSDKTIADIRNGRNWTDVNTFNSLFPRSKNKFYTVFPRNKYMNHFDLDHVLDKSSCPLVALSYQNLVPSCPVCNERLKHSEQIGGHRHPVEYLSPTSPYFYFDDNAKFLVVPNSINKQSSRKTSHPDDYDVKLSINPQYKPFAKLFRLEERYQFHKMVALHWSDMKFRYNKSRIQLMSNALHNASFSPKRIESDIFQNALDKEGRSCFAKLKRDILK